MQSIQKHKIGDLIWSYHSHSLGVVIAYSQIGVHESETYKYSVRYINTNSVFIYTEEMIDDGKRYLRNIYDRS